MTVLFFHDRSAFLMLGGVEDIGGNHAIVVESHNQIFGTALAEQAVLIVAVSPGALTVFDADSPWGAEQRTYLLLGGLADTDQRHLGAGKFPTDRGASGR